MSLTNSNQHRLSDHLLLNVSQGEGFSWNKSKHAGSAVLLSCNELSLRRCNLKRRQRCCHFMLFYGYLYAFFHVHVCVCRNMLWEPLDCSATGVSCPLNTHTLYVILLYTVCTVWACVYIHEKVQSLWLHDTLKHVRMLETEPLKTHLKILYETYERGADSFCLWEAKKTQRTHLSNVQQTEHVWRPTEHPCNRQNRKQRPLGRPTRKRRAM